MRKMEAALGAILILGCAGSAEWPGVTAAPDQVGRARVFAPGVVGDDHVFMATFAPDGKTAYVASRRYRSRTELPTLEIRETRLVDGRWTAPVVAPFSGRYADIDPVMSPDGHRLYFNSSGAGPGLQPHRLRHLVRRAPRRGLVRPGAAA